MFIPTYSAYKNFRQNRPTAALTRNLDLGEGTFPIKKRPKYNGRYGPPKKSEIIGVPWVNVYQNKEQPPWQKDKFGDIQFAFDAIPWTFFVFFTVCDSLTSTGLGQIIKNLFPRQGRIAQILMRAGTRAASIYNHWINGPLWWMTILFAAITGIIMIIKRKKGERESAREFFESFKIMIGNDQRQADYCIDAFSSHGTWTAMTKVFWRNAYNALRGIVGMSDGNPDSDSSTFHSLTLPQRQAYYKEGLLGMFEQQVTMYELMESFRKYAELQKKQDDGKLGNNEKQKLDDAIKNVEQQYNSIGHINSYFGNLWGGYEAFREAAQNASNSIKGNYVAAKTYKAQFNALLHHYSQYASRKEVAAVNEFADRIVGTSELLGFTISESDDRAAYAEFMFLVGYGKAEEVWDKAAVLYNQFEKSESVNMFLPSYSEMMNAWAQRNWEEAEKNRAAHGLRFPQQIPS